MTNPLSQKIKGKPKSLSKTEEKVETEKESVEMEEFFDTTEDELDAFDEACWNKGDGYKLPRFPEVERRLEGLESGLYLFAAESNMGKSAIMSNMLYDLGTCEENSMFVIYYSLDDAAGEIIPRIIAMNERIPISAASKPKRYQNMIDRGEENSIVYQDWLNKRKNGIENLKSKKEQFKIVDGNKIRSIEQMYEHIKKVNRFLKTFYPNKKLAIGIDSINDLRFTTKNLSHGNELVSEVAQTVKGWTVEFDMVIFASTHLRKVNGSRRPTIDDLKDSVELAYEASVVWLVYNDVSRNKQAASIYHNQEGVEEKLPIIEMDWAKNKKSSFKGRTYNYFTQDYSLVTECPEDIMKRFDALVYEG